MSDIAPAEFTPPDTGSATATQLRQLFLSDQPWIDVRAPVEFMQGHLPNAINLPLLNDEERHQVGTIYKISGSDAAVELGHQLVSGSVKQQRIEAWSKYLEVKPAILYCFRGGMRSHITQQWLSNQGIERPLLPGGYKAARRFLLEEITRVSQHALFINVAGATGCGKTKLLKALVDEPVVDLEALAQHRGSAFGAMAHSQPEQATFENHLAVALLKAERRAARLAGTINQPRAILLEDESRTIGKCALPAPVFTALGQAPIVCIDEPLVVRIEGIFSDYVAQSALGSACTDPAVHLPGLSTLFKFRTSIQAIAKRLGGERAREVLNDLELCERLYRQTGEIAANRLWIEKLLVYYYDPFYQKFLKQRESQIRFRGSYADCMAYLQQPK